MTDYQPTPQTPDKVDLLISQLKIEFYKKND